MTLDNVLLSVGQSSRSKVIQSQQSPIKVLTRPSLDELR